MAFVCIMDLGYFRHFIYADALEIRIVRESTTFTKTDRPFVQEAV